MHGLEIESKFTRLYGVDMLKLDGFKNGKTAR